MEKSINKYFKDFLKDYDDDNEKNFWEEFIFLLKMLKYDNKMNDAINKKIISLIIELLLDCEYNNYNVNDGLILLRNFFIKLDNIWFTLYIIIIMNKKKKTSSTS